MTHDLVNPFEEMLQEITAWHNYHKKTSPGTTARLKKRFEQYSKDYQIALIAHKRTNRSYYLSKANNILEAAQKEFKQFKRLEFLATLSK